MNRVFPRDGVSGVTGGAIDRGGTENAGDSRGSSISLGSKASPEDLAAAARALEELGGAIGGSESLLEVCRATPKSIFSESLLSAVRNFGGGGLKRESTACERRGVAAGRRGGGTWNEEVLGGAFFPIVGSSGTSERSSNSPSSCDPGASSTSTGMSTSSSGEGTSKTEPRDIDVRGFCALGSVALLVAKAPFNALSDGNLLFFSARSGSTRETPGSRLKSSTWGFRSLV